jgi:hypothetical protein
MNNRGAMREIETCDAKFWSEGKSHIKSVGLIRGRLPESYQKVVVDGVNRPVIFSLWLIRQPIDPVNPEYDLVYDGPLDQGVVDAIRGA